MVYRLILIALLGVNLFGAAALNKEWPSGETLLTFLEKNALPLRLYYDLDRQDKLTVSEIIAGASFYVLETPKEIQQVLIPLGDDIQIHIYKDKENRYALSIIPIIYQTVEKTLVLDVHTSPYQDILDNSDNYLLALEFIYSFKKSIDFKREVRYGNKIAIVYDENIRLGKFWGTPKIKASLVETHKKANYIFLNDDGRYYNQKGKEVESFLLSNPVRYNRISSKFTMRRWHPVLKRYRPHFGIDYAAPRGTPVKSAGNGKVVYAGRKGGYGNVIEVLHEEGYKTLYAHLKKFRGGIRRGTWVKKGQTIGYVGTTGTSTGPHLHFGLYKNNRPINPASIIKVTKKKLRGKAKKKFLTLAEEYKTEITGILKEYNDLRIGG